jgi:hypothetical protein
MEVQPWGRSRSSWHASIHFWVQHNALLSGRFVASADEDRGRVAAIDCHMQNVRWNVNVIAGPDAFAMFKLVSSPKLHEIAACHVERRPR